MSSRIDMAWTAIEGAEKYAEEVRLGNLAAPETRAERASECSVCDSATRWRLPVLGWVYGFCGSKFKDRTRDEKPTCGCLVFFSKKCTDPSAIATARPAGKTCLLSEHCPQGKW